MRKMEKISQLGGHVNINHIIDEENSEDKSPLDMIFPTCSSCSLESAEQQKVKKITKKVKVIKVIL